MDSQILIVELKHGGTPEEWQTALSAPYERGYYFVCTIGRDCERAVYKLKQASASGFARSPANRDGNEAQALKIIAANAQVPVRRIVELLAAAGIARGRNWVAEKRSSITAKPRATPLNAMESTM